MTLAGRHYRNSIVIIMGRRRLYYLGIKSKDQQQYVSTATQMTNLWHVYQTWQAKRTTINTNDQLHIRSVELMVIIKLVCNT